MKWEGGGRAAASAAFAKVVAQQSAAVSTTFYFDQFDAQRAYSDPVGAPGITVSPATQSTTFSDIAEMSVTLEPHGGKVLVFFQAFALNTADSELGLFRLTRDGTEIGTRGVVNPVSNDAIMLQHVDSPAAGSHTYKAQFAFSATVEGAERLECFDVYRSIQAVEI